jgi:hypothetical protein
MSLIGMVALITAGCDGSADPASTTNPISSCLSTGVGCPPATDTATGTNTGTLTVATVTDSNTGTTTGTDTTPVNTVPAWCNEQAYTSSKIGTPINTIGLWVATCDGVVWNIYVKYTSSSVASIKGWGFKASDMDAAPSGYPVPSSANYTGVMADNCVYLVPTPLASSTDTSAPTITGSTASVSGGVSGGNCTMTLAGTGTYAVHDTTQ